MSGGKWTGAHINGTFTATLVRTATPSKEVALDDRSSTDLYAELDDQLKSLKSELNQ